MKQKHPHWLKNGVARVTQAHIILVIAYVAQIIVYDASKLITPDVVLKRWEAIAALSVVCVSIWYIARSKATTLNHYKLLTWLLILSDIAFAAFNVYTQRGMASRAVLLFVVPIVVASILVSRVALFSTALLCVTIYTTTAVVYFVNYFNEGYKVELYGEILFYSTILLMTAALLWASVKVKHRD